MRIDVAGDFKSNVTKQIVFVVSILLGICVEFIGSNNSSTGEAWDYFPGYLPWLAGAGFVCGLIGRGNPFLWYSGLFIGQALYLIFLFVFVEEYRTDAELVLAGLLMLPFLSLVALPTAWIGGLIGRLFVKDRT